MSDLIAKISPVERDRQDQISIAADFQKFIDHSSIMEIVRWQVIPAMQKELEEHGPESGTSNHDRTAWYRFSSVIKYGERIARQLDETGSFTPAPIGPDIPA